MFKLDNFKDILYVDSYQFCIYFTHTNKTQTLTYINTHIRTHTYTLKNMLQIYTELYVYRIDARIFATIKRNNVEICIKSADLSVVI